MRPFSAVSVDTFTTASLRPMRRIDLEDALHVRVDDALTERAARARLQFGEQLVGLDAAVAESVPALTTEFSLTVTTMPPPTRRTRTSENMPELYMARTPRSIPA